MVTLIGLTRTLAVTRDLHAVLSMKLAKQRKTITFRNGFRFRLIWSQFRVLRDSYPLVKNHAVKQLENDLFRMANGRQMFSGSLVTITTVCELFQKYVIEQLGDDFFRIRNDKVQLAGSAGMLYSVLELETGVYDCDCRGKTILDIGGFQGESAVFFSTIGASKIVIYEPVPDHYEAIRGNLSANHVNAEVHMEGVGDSDRTQTILYDKASLGFGILGKGNRELEIRIRDISKVIKESGADIAKFDCEGAEESLLNVPAETLRKIELYLIEVHTPTIRRDIIKKFKGSGFKLMKEKKRDVLISMLYLKRNLNLRQLI